MDFTWAESASTSLDEQPRILGVQFGDGYAQRSPDGLNPITQVWQVSFTNVSTANGDAIMAFFRARAGWQPFSWFPLWGNGIAINVVASKWSRTQHDDPDLSSISVTFTQDHAP